MLANLERWRDLCQRIRAKDNPVNGRTIDGTYDEIIYAYNRPGRHYHTLEHISNGLRSLDEVRHLLKDIDSVEAGWWGHDYVYRPGNHFNEEDSVFYWSKILHELGVSTPLRIRVMNRIMATRHDHIPTDFNDRIMVDIDLIGLGSAPEEFDQNTIKNREEYRKLVPNDNDCLVGQAKFFKN